VDEQIRRLARYSIFGGLEEEELEWVAGALQVRRYDTGEEVVREGDPGSEMFGIYEGEVEVVKSLPRGDEEQRIATLRAGDCFGEMSLIDVQARSATVRTLGPSVLWSLSNKDLRRLCEWSASAFALIMSNVAREISRRLRRVDEIAAEFLHASPADLPPVERG
jgi:CRP-like cAMP-binding protein